MLIKLKYISNRTLFHICVFGSVATVGMGLLTKNKISNNVKRTEYCKEALACLRTHKGAILLLGEPIRDLTINIGDSNKNFTNENQAQYEIPVCGSKKRGRLYFWADKQPEDKWVVSRIELELQNDPYKRLLIKNVDGK